MVISKCSGDDRALGFFCFFFVLFSFIYTFSSEDVIFYYFLIYLCFWLCSVFVAARGLPRCGEWG